MNTLKTSPWVTAILVALVTGVLGILVVGFVTSVHGGWYHLGGYNEAIATAVYGIVGGIGSLAGGFLLRVLSLGNGAR